MNYSLLERDCFLGKLLHLNQRYIRKYSTFMKLNGTGEYSESWRHIRFPRTVRNLSKNPIHYIARSFLCLCASDLLTSAVVFKPWAHGGRFITHKLPCKYAGLPFAQMSLAWWSCNMCFCLCEKIGDHMMRRTSVPWLGHPFLFLVLLYVFLALGMWIRDEVLLSMVLIIHCFHLMETKGEIDNKQLYV